MLNHKCGTFGPGWRLGGIAVVGIEARLAAQAYQQQMCEKLLVTHAQNRLFAPTATFETMLREW